MRHFVLPGGLVGKGDLDLDQMIAIMNKTLYPSWKSLGMTISDLINWFVVPEPHLKLYRARQTSLKPITDREPRYKV